MQLTYEAMMKPFLLCLADGQPHPAKQVREFAKEYHHLTETDISTLLPSGRQTIFTNRVSWAGTYLFKAGLITKPSRGVFMLTDEGRSVLAENPAEINSKFLCRYESVREFLGRSASTEDGAPPSESTETPDDTLENAFLQIKASLADELMAEVMKLKDTTFERMVLDLMKKMGYGTFDDASRTTSASGDEGIDGIIMQDKLGFDLIYVQAKHWDSTHTVGRPEIQAFVGAISGRGGNGLFVTTSKFSKQAIEYAKMQHIILIDGAKLTELMIEYNFGVTVQKTFEIKTLDSDVFFAYQDD